MKIMQSSLNEMGDQPYSSYMSPEEHEKATIVVGSMLKQFVGKLMVEARKAHAVSSVSSSSSSSSGQREESSFFPSAIQGMTLDEERRRQQSMPWHIQEAYNRLRLGGKVDLNDECVRRSGLAASSRGSGQVLSVEGEEGGEEEEGGELEVF